MREMGNWHFSWGFVNTRAGAPPRVEIKKSSRVPLLAPGYASPAGPWCAGIDRMTRSQEKCRSYARFYDAWGEPGRGSMRIGSVYGV